MSKNFKILIDKQRGDLHVKLKGDFDGSSACELLNFLKKNAHNVRSFVIHTGYLNNIHPFGRDVFQRKFSETNIKRNSIIFTGEKIGLIAPELS